MRRFWWIAFLVCGITACGVNRQERVQEFANDGLRLYQCGDYRHARETFEAALALAPGDVTLQYDLAECWDHLGRLDKAEVLYRDCLQRAPNDPETHHALTLLLMRTGRRDEAVQSVQDWLARQPQLAAPYAEDAYLWHEFGDLKKTQARLQQAYVLDPHDNRTLVEMGRLYEELHYPDRAMSLYEQALACHPNQPDVEQRLSQLRTQGVSRPHPN